MISWGKWVQDDEGDIGLELFWGLITFLKYKHTVLVHWFKRLPEAEKFQGKPASPPEYAQQHGPERRYDIIYPRHYHNLKDSTVMAIGLTRAEVIKERAVCGDLVVYSSTKDLVIEPWWLFNWEVDETGAGNPSYAVKAIRYHAKNLRLG